MGDGISDLKKRGLPWGHGTDKDVQIAEMLHEIDDELVARHAQIAEMADALRFYSELEKAINNADCAADMEEIEAQLVAMHENQAGAVLKKYGLE